jgi:hypothetical protein
MVSSSSMRWINLFRESRVRSSSKTIGVMIYHLCSVLSAAVDPCPPPQDMDIVPVISL